MMRIAEKKMKIVKELAKAKGGSAAYRIHGEYKCIQLHAPHCKLQWGLTKQLIRNLRKKIPCSKGQGKTSFCWKHMI